MQQVQTQQIPRPTTFVKAVVVLIAAVMAMFVLAGVPGQAHAVYYGNPEAARFHHGVQPAGSNACGSYAASYAINAVLGEEATNGYKIWTSSAVGRSSDHRDFNTRKFKNYLTQSGLGKRVEYKYDFTDGWNKSWPNLKNPQVIVNQLKDGWIPFISFGGAYRPLNQGKSTYTGGHYICIYGYDTANKTFYVNDSGVSKALGAGVRYTWNQMKTLCNGSRGFELTMAVRSKDWKYGRVCDTAFYAAKNPDLKKKFGTNKYWLRLHFIQNGINEPSRIGKTHENFNADYYAKNYKDLRNEFGYPLTKENIAKYYKHYVTWNISNKENRVANRLINQTYTVTFKDGVTKKTIKTQKVKSGKNATAPNPPKHAGYTFNKWSGSYKNIKKNTTVTAVYKKVATYTVTFKDGVTNKVLKTQKVERGKNATPPKLPKHNGYAFSKWSGNYKNVTSNRTITAVYSRQPISTIDGKYTITYHPNGGYGLDIPTKAAKGQSYKFARCPFIRFGYKFVGWNTKADGSGTTYWAKQPVRVNGDMHLYAQWRKR